MYEFGAVWEGRRKRIYLSYLIASVLVRQFPPITISSSMIVEWTEAMTNENLPTISSQDQERPYHWILIMTQTIRLCRPMWSYEMLYSLSHFVRVFDIWYDEYVHIVSRCHTAPNSCISLTWSSITNTVNMMCSHKKHHFSKDGEHLVSVLVLRYELQGFTQGFQSSYPSGDSL